MVVIKRPKVIHKKRVRLVKFKHAGFHETMTIDTRIGAKGLYPGDLVYIQDLSFTRSRIYMVIGLRCVSAFNRKEESKYNIYDSLCYAVPSNDKDLIESSLPNGFLYHPAGSSPTIYLLKRFGEDHISEMRQSNTVHVTGKVVDVRSHVYEFLESINRDRDVYDNYIGEPPNVVRRIRASSSRKSIC